jgi:CheY-like chemotaxis protein
VVEDDEDVRNGLQDVLEEAGYCVSTAVNGRDAIDRLSALAPQLILLDLMMPVMNGVEFLAALRQHATLSATPVVVVSAWPKEAQAVDAQGFLAKPVHLSALLSIVQRFCSP